MATYLRYGAAALAVLLGFATAAYLLVVGENSHNARRIDPLMTRSDEFTEVIRDLTRARAVVPQNPETIYLLGRIYNEKT